MFKKFLKVVVTIVCIIILVTLLSTFGLHRDYMSPRGFTIKQMTRLKRGLEIYKELCGSYPTTQEGLSLVFEAGGQNPKCSGRRGHMPSRAEEALLKDYSGDFFDYESDGKTFLIRSKKENIDSRELEKK